MALSNPLNIVFWLGIYGAMLARTSDIYSTGLQLLYTSGIFLGIFLWDFIMASVASSFKKMLSSKAQQFISVIAGLSLIGFGLYFGYEAIVLIF
ncbi:LysE type translocator [compost metagenome]